MLLKVDMILLFHRHLPSPSSLSPVHIYPVSKACIPGVEGNDLSTTVCKIKLIVHTHIMPGDSQDKRRHYKPKIAIL